MAVELPGVVWLVVWVSGSLDCCCLNNTTQHTPPPPLIEKDHSPPLSDHPVYFSDLMRIQLLKHNASKSLSSGHLTEWVCNLFLKDVGFALKIKLWFQDELISSCTSATRYPAYGNIIVMVLLCRKKNLFQYGPDPVATGAKTVSLFTEFLELLGSERENVKYVIIVKLTYYITSKTNILYPSHHFYILSLWVCPLVDLYKP